MTESDMFPPSGKELPECGICKNGFYTDTSFSLHFCSEECIRVAVKKNHRSVGIADRYFVKLCVAEARIKELESQIMQ